MTLIDAGNFQRLERFGSYTLQRPSPVALWRPKQPKWEADALFSRDGGKRWQGPNVPEGPWSVDVGGFDMEFRLTEFGHLGYFPEHEQIWQWARERIHSPLRVLNLFAYSGAASLACALAGAEVTHVDSAPGMIEWGKINAEKNSVTTIRWIVDDVRKFCEREVRRKKRYDAILLDPPSFGRGSKGEVFKIEDHLLPLLETLKQLLSEGAAFVVLSCHTPGLDGIVLSQLLRDGMGLEAEGGELNLEAESGVVLPTGTFARWQC